MASGKPLVRLLQRRFTVAVSAERAWAHLEQVEQWPTWALHIRSVELVPPGPLTASSRGTIRLTNGIRSTFHMTELRPPRNWKWVGPFLWMTVHYDHVFRVVETNETEITFTLDGSGFGARVLGRLFAAIYARNLDRAIPNLVREIECGAASL
jgi:hypothetical protein